MVQLSDDCFAFGGKLMSVEQAQLLLAQNLTPVVRTELVALDQAMEHILDQDLMAPVDVPPFPNSAVDGYGVRFQDLAQTSSFKVQGLAKAGHPYTQALQPNQAVRILTGAALPPGCDTIFMQEDVKLNGDQLEVPKGLKKGANTRPQGEDQCKGFMALPAGIRLEPAHLAVCASLGLDQIQVRRPLKLALFSTGDELQPPGQELRAGQLYDANQVLLSSLMQKLGFETVLTARLPDDAKTTEAQLDQASQQADMIITSGGVSTGDEDHVKAAIQAQGQLRFWRLAIKPGRPVAFGQVSTTPVLGLPGNPVAAFIGWLTMVRPASYLLQGLPVPALETWDVAADFDYKKKLGRREFVRVRLEVSDDGSKRLKRYHKDGAGMLSGLAWASGLAILDEDCQVIEPGQICTYLPFTALP